VKFYPIKTNNLLQPITFILLVFLFYSGYYVYNSVYLSFKYYLEGTVHSSVFSDYIWLRNTALVLIFLFIFIAVIMNILFNNSKVFQSNISLIFIPLLFIFSFYNFTYTATKFKYFGAPSIAIKCDKLQQMSNPLFIWDNSQASQAALSLNLCSLPTFSLTDPFPVELPTANKTFNVVYFSYDNDEKIWDSLHIGKFSSNANLTSPCDIKCLLNEPGFTKYDSAINLGSTGF
jgi:hypothetical protein